MNAFPEGLEGQIALAHFFLDNGMFRHYFVSE